MAKKGRPSKYTDAIAETICNRLSRGESLLQICKDADMPSRISVHAWLLSDEHKDFLNRYNEAKALQADFMFDELVEIADDGTNDYMERMGKNGEAYECLNAEHVQRSRLRIDTRKWYLSKVLPKKYGEKLDVTSDGKELPTPIIQINR